MGHCCDLSTLRLECDDWRVKAVGDSHAGLLIASIVF